MKHPTPKNDAAGDTIEPPVAGHATEIYDALHRRRTVKAQDATTWDYTYNDRSELLTGARKLPNAQFLAGQQYRYTYDNLGNIILKRTGGNAAGSNFRSQASPANTLNQYASYQTPSSFDVLGQAPAGSTVTVNGIAATLQDTYFRANVATDNSGANGIWQSVAITNAGVTTTGNLYIPPATFTPTYDLDGNLTDDGEWTYLWDAGNRMKTATRAARAVTAGAPYRRYEHTYDAMSRLVQTKTFATVGTTVLKTEQYIYNGWNRVAMLESAGTATPALRQSYAWGLDISAQNGNPGQDSGGVGALLVVTDTQLGSHCPCYDSNGNIIAMVNAATKAISAQYEYSPFGETTRATGPFAEANPYRFSTKPTDSETGLIYYGYRFYKPKWQTWPSPDPIGERGGVNLYGFVKNNVGNSVDVLGETGFQFTNAFGEPLPGTPGHPDYEPPPPNPGITGDIIDYAILDKPIQKKLFHHYRYGNGATLPITVDEYFSTLPDAQNLNIFSIPDFPTEEGIHKIENQRFVLNSLLPATLNSHFVYLDGILCINDQGVFFDGTIEIKDTYDFDWKKFNNSGRGWAGEIKTRLVSLTVPGSAYDIELGPVPFKQKSPDSPTIDGKPVPSSPSGGGGN